MEGAQNGWGLTTGKLSFCSEWTLDYYTSAFYQRDGLSKIKSGNQKVEQQVTREARPALEYPIICSEETEHLQKLHYDRIGTEYELHYGDPCSRQYRERFINQPMFEGIELSGMRVLEAMCGNGQTTEHLLSRGAIVTGLDISPAEIDSFKRHWPDCDAKCSSMIESGFADDSFDCIAIVGGLHHLHPRLGEAVGEIHRILKPGGFFCFAEPYQGSLPDLVRSFWYKHDKLFAVNEASIDFK
jgi:SAM-dependent methyltransferase